MESEQVVTREMRSLSLNKVHLHIENVVPSTSLASYEDKKAAITRRVSGHHASHHEEEQHHDQQLEHTGQENSSPDNNDQWTQHQIADRMAWMKSFKPNKKGGIVFQDQDAIKKQQGVFKEVMMQVGSQLLTGKLAVRISLPIRIFEPRTLLERVADGWNYAPTLLKKAALATEPLERMKLVMAFVVGGVHFCVGQLKPFNPILGETYEATYADGTQIFMEHVAHHPVQSAFQVIGADELYEIHGMYEFESVTSRNAIYNHQIGKTTIRFQDGQTITYTLPQIKMSGLLFGERVVEISGIAKFEDTANELCGEVNFDANSGGFLFGKSQADDIKGQIVSTCSTPKRRKSFSVSKNNTAAVLSTIHGSWLTHLQCDDKEYWNVETDAAFAHVPVATPLPSDCRFREDLVALQNGDLELAQSEKLRLEELQRSDHKQREHADKKKHRTRRGSSAAR